MRRSGSASCLLRPRHSLSAEDLRRLSTGGPGVPTASVLTVDRLPSAYCADKLYVLSELHVHANSVRFLCDVDDEGVPAAGGGEGSGAGAGAGGGDAEGDDAAASFEFEPAFPPSVILYLPWRPGTYPAPRQFADGPVSESVRRILLANGDDVSFSSGSGDDGGDFLEGSGPQQRSPLGSSRRKMSSSGQLASLVGSSSDVEEEDDSCEGTTSDGKPIEASYGSPGRRRERRHRQRQMTRIYVVVDRISASDDDDAANDVGEEEQEQELPNDNDGGGGNGGDAAKAKNDGVGELPNFKNPASSSSSSGTSFEEEVRTSCYKTTKSSGPSSQNNRGQRQLNKHDSEVRIAEQLARAVASSRFLRGRIDGISIGIASDARASPGLEACTDAVSGGAAARERRRLAPRGGEVRRMRKELRLRRQKQQQQQQQQRQNGRGGDDAKKNDDVGRMERALDCIRERSPERSPVAVVAVRPDDLEAASDHHDHSHHHHHHSDGDHDANNDDAAANSRILQCRVSTEWNGRGEHKTFAERAMGDWRRAWCGDVSAGESIVVRDNNNGGNNKGGAACRPKVPRISSRGAGEGEQDNDGEDADINEPVSTAMVIVFLIAAAAYAWDAYGDLVLSFLFGNVLEEG